MAQRLKCLPPRFNPWVEKIPWRRKWQPTPVFLPGEPHGWRSLVGYSPWGCKESDRTEQLHFQASTKLSMLLSMRVKSVLLSLLKDYLKDFNASESGSGFQSLVICGYNHLGLEINA